jgi:hypothetical protein
MVDRCLAISSPNVVGHNARMHQPALALVFVRVRQSDGCGGHVARLVSHDTPSSNRVATDSSSCVRQSMQAPRFRYCSLSESLPRLRLRYNICCVHARVMGSFGPQPLLILTFRFRLNCEARVCIHRHALSRRGIMWSGSRELAKPCVNLCQHLCTPIHHVEGCGMTEVGTEGS